MNYDLLKDLIHKNISITDLSNSLDIDRTNLSKRIKNNNLTIEMIEKIAVILEVPFMNFFEGVDGLKIYPENIDEEITTLKKEIADKSNRITELEKHLENYKLLIDLLKKTNAISGADLYYKTLPEKDRPKFDDEPNWEEVGKQPFPIDDPDEKIKFAEKLAKEKKKKNDN
ncbi:MAG: helix-turn-helix domain-containing protein [Bacteroidales bacterium]|jgi:DNA-binding Xre family transcriptional regulator|nr:helix-turn-helix domain-containing protein [Bacteroidales bacterium]